MQASMPRFRSISPFGFRIVAWTWIEDTYMHTQVRFAINPSPTGNTSVVLMNLRFVVMVPLDLERNSGLIFVDCKYVFILPACFQIKGLLHAKGSRQDRNRGVVAAPGSRHHRNRGRNVQKETRQKTRAERFFAMQLGIHMDAISK